MQESARTISEIKENIQNSTTISEEKKMHKMRHFLENGTIPISACPMIELTFSTACLGKMNHI